MSSRRRSNGLLRRWATATRSRLTCASASSHSSRGACMHSAAQSRKLDRKPCGPAPTCSSGAERPWRGVSAATRSATGTRCPRRGPGVVEHGEHTRGQGNAVNAARLHALGAGPIPWADPYRSDGDGKPERACFGLGGRSKRRPGRGTLSNMEPRAEAHCAADNGTLGRGSGL